MKPDLNPTIDRIKQALERTNADPVRVDRLLMVTLLDNLQRLERITRDPPVSLTATERAIYRALAEADGAIVSDMKLAEVVRSRTIASLWVHIRRLRAKFEDAGITGERIDTVRGHGYMLRRES